VPDTTWDQRFFTTTRGRIVLLLRSQPRTVEQLAAALQLTDNAVRAHLITLERDGLIRQSGQVRTARRPSLSYELAPDAERLFPKAYGTVLSAFLTALRREVGPRVVTRTLRAVGRQLSPPPPPASNMVDRAEIAAKVLEELGGSVELEHTDEGVHIRGRSCPLAVVVHDHPDVCEMVQSLLEEATGMEVREQCDRGEQSHCHFLLRLSERDDH
jgi:predicted ArsR family transcriptional regulator